MVARLFHFIMKAFKILLFLFGCIALQSCSLIKYGRSTKVTIESKTEGEPVHLLAIGQKKIYDYSNVTSPFEMKVRHKDVPLRLHAFSDDIDYAPLSINGKKVGEGESGLWKLVGWSSLASSAVLSGIFIGTGDFDGEAASVYGSFAAAGLGMIGLGAVTEFRVPESKYYFFSGDSIRAFNEIMRSPQWRALRIRDDVYTLLEKESYELALAEIDYLFDKMRSPLPEMYFLKGACLYHMREYKKAIKNLHAALNSNDNPQELNEQIMSYIKAAEDGRAAQLEKRRQMWLDITQTALQVTSTVLSAKQQYDAALTPGVGQSAGGAVGSALDMEIPEVLRPEYAAQFIQPEYTYDSNGNLMVSYPRWAEYEGQMNAAVQSQVASTAGQLMESGDSYYVSKAKSLQAQAKTHDWTTKLSQQFWLTPMYPEAFVGMEFEENDRELLLSAAVYSGRTGSEVTSFRFYRTGNDRYTGALRRFCSSIVQMLPVKGRVIARNADTVLVDLGTSDGIVVGTELDVIKSGVLSTPDMEIGIVYSAKDVLGKITITEVSETVSQGKYDRNGFYDRMNLNDEVVPVPVTDTDGTVAETDTAATQVSIVPSAEDISGTEYPVLSRMLQELYLIQ